MLEKRTPKRRDMTEHVSKSTMERFCLSALSEAELAAITDHLAECKSCHQLFADALREQRGSAGLFPIEPHSWLKDDHIEFESLARLADDDLDAADREWIDAHLSKCTECREDVASFLDFMKQIEPELSVHYGPTAQEPRRDALLWWSWWRNLAWKPAYTAALVVIGIAVAIGAVLIFRRNQNLQTQQVPTAANNPSFVPDDRIATVPSPSVTPLESTEPGKDEAVVSLNDRGGTVSVDRTRKVTGLDGVPATTREEIAKVLLSERIEAPAILKELGGQDGALRGTQKAQPFKLLSPTRTVILSDRPALEWEKAPGATSYRVYVNDEAGSEVAKSDELALGRTNWTSPRPLKRGEIYTWTVVAVVDGKEIVSPGPAAPEMKFQVLSERDLQLLGQLKKTRSHLALTIFYASVGMISEAEREVQQLFNLNPQSQKVRALLNRIKSMRGSAR
jgi:hypothetical protein